MGFGAWFMNKAYTFGNAFYDLVMTRQSDRVVHKYEKMNKNLPPYVAMKTSVTSHSVDEKENKIIIKYVFSYEPMFFC